MTACSFYRNDGDAKEEAASNWQVMGTTFAEVVDRSGRAESAYGITDGNYLTTGGAAITCRGVEDGLFTGQRA